MRRVSDGAGVIADAGAPGVALPSTTALVQRLTRPLAPAEYAARVVVDELLRAGVREFCISPGARSAPLALAIAHACAGTRAQAFAILDERTSGFFALGLARRTHRPVAVVCTSGSALAHLMPAVVEADGASLPLVVLSADRPPELQHRAAAQTIDQQRFYGRFVRWFVDTGVFEPDHKGAERWLRSTIARALHEALAGPGGHGPVHINLPFREPLVGRGSGAAAELSSKGRRDSAAAWTIHLRAPALPEPGGLDEIAERLAQARAPMVVVGAFDIADPGEAGRVRAALAGLCQALEAPCLADLVSNLGGGQVNPRIVEAYDLLLDQPTADLPGRPDVVLHIGEAPLGRPTWSWLATLDDALHIRLSADGRCVDPDGLTELILAGDLADLCLALAARIRHEADVGVAPIATAARQTRLRWREAWIRLGRATRQKHEERAIAAVFDEDAVVRVLAGAWPDKAILHLGNSLAVRVANRSWPRGRVPERVLSQRGANGIDGAIAGILGEAAGGPGPVIGLIGDVAFFHDAGALLLASQIKVPALIIVLENGGGRIFDSLEMAQQVAPADWQRFFQTPPRIPIGDVCRAYGVAHAQAGNPDEMRAAFATLLEEGRAAVLEVRCFVLRDTDRHGGA